MASKARSFGLFLALMVVGFAVAVPPHSLYACSSCNFLFTEGSTHPRTLRFSAPYAVAVGADSSGNMYVVNRVVNRIEKFTPIDAYVTHWGCTATNPTPVTCSTVFGNSHFMLLATASIAPTLSSGKATTIEKNLSEVAETYLETVYLLRETEGSARTGAIADALGVTAGSVSPTMASLQSRGLVRRRKGHRGFELTPKGERVVMQILRKRRLAERLLTDMLGMKWTEVHATAARLAHGITSELADILERALKSPATCPHGNPIPNSSGSIRQPKTEFLGELGSGQEATLASVTINKKDLLRYLEKVGLVPGASVRVEQKCPFDGALIVNISGTRVPVGKYVASSIRITRK